MKRSLHVWATFQAHQQCRKADRLLAAGKYEEAISCHGKAAGELSFLNKLRSTTFLFPPPQHVVPFKATTQIVTEHLVPSNGDSHVSPSLTAHVKHSERTWEVCNGVQLSVSVSLADFLTDAMKTTECEQVRHSRSW